MDDDAIFATVADQRRAVADVVESLEDAQLSTPSLCGTWDVKTVAAHLTVLFTVGKRDFAMALLRSRGSFDRANDAIARRLGREPVEQIVERLRRRATSRATPPVGGARAALTDLLVHGGDLRIPLGLPFDPPPAALQTALDFVSGKAVGFVPKGRLDGICLAPDDGIGSWGTGAELTGRSHDLLMAACGRPAVLDRLDGPGRQVLATRLRR